MSITVRYSSIDGFSKTRKFKTIEGARKFAVRYVGEHPDHGGGNYAVSFDGVGKVTVQGCTLAALFDAAEPDEAGVFEVHAGCVNEDRGTVSYYKVATFATLHAAAEYAQQADLEGNCDGIKLVGTTDEAKAAIAAHMAAQAKLLAAQAYMDADCPF